MKRGFTLLEILIVIIIIAVLATLAFNQYTLTVERSRGAELKTVFGHLRSLCAAIYMENGTTDECGDEAMGIDNSGSKIPITGSCQPTHFFAYESNPAGGGGDTVTFTATRCTAGSGGKSPWPDANVVTLTVDYAAGGNDSWDWSNANGIRY